MRRTLHALLAILAIVALTATPITAETPSGVRGGAQPLVYTVIATGADNSVDGYLDVEPDEYGAFGDFGFAIAGTGRDRYNPVGPVELNQATFTDGFFLTVPALSQRALLASSIDWQGIFPPDAVPLVPSVVSPTVASDTNGDGINDTLTSSFRVDSPDVAISADVRSTVHRAGGPATLRQDYTFTNEGAMMVTFRLTRVFDGDLLYTDFDFANDEVGTLANPGGRGVFAFQRDPSDPATATVLHGPGARKYFGGKNGIEPGGGPPPYGFGTDFQVWDNYGTPPTWENNIAAVGYDTNGVSGPTPVGCDEANGCDGFVGIDWEITLMPGVSRDVTVFHTYGSQIPIVGGIGIAGTCPGNVNIQISGGTPDGLAAVLTGSGTGADALPGGPCAGQLTGLTSPSLLAAVPYDANGRIVVSRSVPAGACGRLIQVLDVSTCGLSNVTNIP